MQERLIEFPTAKLAKEKGFNEFYYAEYYDKDGNDWHGFSSNLEDYEDKYVKSSQSLLQKWLREEHNIAVLVTYYDNNISEYYFFIYTDISKRYSDRICSLPFKSKRYEDVLEEGLYQALKLIK